jgi:AraC-like DNA-binding protein
MSSPPDTQSIAAPRVELHLASAPRFDAFAIWQASLANLFDATLVGEHGAKNFHGEVTGFHLGDTLTFNNASVAQRLVRDAGRVRRSGVDHIMLQYQTSGRLVGDYDDRSVELNTGDIGFVDFGRATASEDTDFSRITLIVPRERLPQAFRARELHGVVLDGNNAATRLLGQYMTALLQSAGQLTASEASAAVNAAFVLAEGAWNAAGELDLEQHSEARRTLRRMAMNIVDRRLARPDLTPASIAAMLGISRSTLYALFEPEGGIESHIFARRLDRAFDAIVSDSIRAAGIGEIAFASGFKSEAHFSRAFLARFGVRPSEVRRLVTARAVRASAQGDDEAAGVTLADWVKMLGSGAPVAS